MGSGSPGRALRLHVVGACHTNRETGHGPRQLQHLTILWILTCFHMDLPCLLVKTSPLQAILILRLPKRDTSIGEANSLEKTKSRTRPAEFGLTTRETPSSRFERTCKDAARTTILSTFSSVSITTRSPSPKTTVEREPTEESIPRPFRYRFESRECRYALAGQCSSSAFPLRDLDRS